MTVIIQSRGIELSDALRGYCEAHLVQHIRRFYDNAAAQLVVQFNDTNGTKGGLDQEVHLTFHLPPRARTSWRLDFSFSSRSLLGATATTGMSSSISARGPCLSSAAA